MKQIGILSYSCSGLTGWIWNCLIELNVKISAANDNDILEIYFKFKKKIDHLFDEYETIAGDITKCCVANLCDRESFVFRNDIAVVDFTHHLPSINSENFKFIIGIRDPRDNMLSLSRSFNMQPDDFHSFCLKQIPVWISFYEGCLNYKPSQIFRFEDRKRDELSFLLRIVNFMGLQFDHQKLIQALNSASLEKAGSFEKSMKIKHPEVFQQMFPGGIVKSGLPAQYRLKENYQHKKVFDFIVKQTAPTMRNYGYAEEEIYGDRVQDTLKIKEIFNQLPNN
jgi:hypothetical protein